MWDEAIPIGRIGDAVLVPGVIEHIIQATPERPWPEVAVRIGRTLVPIKAHLVIKPESTAACRKRNTED